MPGEQRADAVAKIGDLAAGAGIRRVHVLSWRDLADVEAGGSEVHASEIARLWAEAGLEVTLRSSYAQGQPTTVQRDGYRVVRRAGRYMVFPRAVATEMLGRLGPRDGLVEYWNGMPFLSPLWERRPSVVVLHHVHGEMWRMVLGAETPALAKAGELLEGRIAPLAYRRSRIVTLSESSKADIVQQLGLRAANVDVVAPGVDARFSPGGERSASPLVVAVGRLVPVKRYDLLLAACAEARRTIGDLQLVIVGEGYERPALEERVRALDGDSWVRFAGFLRDHEVVDLYRRAWVVASASAREGWGMALTEAAACGTPAVATRIGGHEDAVRPGESGLLTDGTAAALGAGLAQVLSDTALRERLAAGALRRASELTW
ncbi:MAG: glycosyltransferase family 4 protein, partial [Acidimicrobiia bacterium]|nr:glycosyltransferase family 4 protein [Acidimicrobiia bacterium]